MHINSDVLFIKHQKGPTCSDLKGFLTHVLFHSHQKGGFLPQGAFWFTLILHCGQLRNIDGTGQDHSGAKKCQTKAEETSSCKADVSPDHTGVTDTQLL